jgi:[citrate (pro-3S)-lyase] ligase
MEYAALHCDHLYVFAISESGSMFSPAERLEMIRKGTEDIPNCHVFESDLYLVSRATFPAYFIRDEERADLVKSDLDIELFGSRIAPALNITKRFVGEEPYSEVTKAYNERMKELLPERGIMLCEIPRYEGISAGKVRSLLRAGDIGSVRKMVPETTYEIIQRQS